MVRTAAACVAGAMLLGAAVPTRAESFPGMKYLGGLSQNRRSQVGALVLDGGQLRFADRKGRVVFVLPLAGARAFVGAEKRTTLGSTGSATVRWRGSSSELHRIAEAINLAAAEAAARTR